MIKKEDVKKKINKLREFAEEMAEKSKEEKNNSLSSGYLGLSMGYKAAADMLESLLEDD